MRHASPVRSFSNRKARARAYGYRPIGRGYRPQPAVRSVACRAGGDDRSPRARCGRSSRSLSGGPPVVGYFSYLVLCGFFRDMNPAWVAVARDLYAHERVEGMLVDTVVAMTHDGAVDIP